METLERDPETMQEKADEAMEAMLPINNYLYIDEKGEHLHTLRGKPLIGTSSVVKTAYPFSNLYWASGMACSIFGWLNPKYNSSESVKTKANEVLEQIKGLDVETYLSLLDKAYKAHAEKRDLAAEAGTDLHSLLEDYVKECISTNEGKPLLGLNAQIQGFTDWAIGNVEKFLASEVHTYSEKKWLGGIVDCVAKLKDGKIAIFDFKSSKEAYDGHFFQISLYDIQLREKGGYTPRGDKILKLVKADCYIVVPFGNEKLVPAIRYNTKQLREVGRSLLKTYRVIKKI